MIKISNLTKMFGKRVLFSDFSYDFPSNGLIALIGESGTGKSTLLNLISGLDDNYEGTIEIDGVNLKKMMPNKKANFRIQNIGYLFQNFNLLNLESGFNNVYMPLDTISMDKTMLKKQRVSDVLRLVGMYEKSKQRVNKMSGGEKQRIALARAIVNDPKVVLCDEPTGALDEKNSFEIFNFLKQISKTTLVIVATHDFEGIKNLADRTIVLKDQKLKLTKLDNKQKTDSTLLISAVKKKKNPRVPILFKIRYSFQKIKAKKYRSLVVNFMLSLSLTGVGLSLILSNSVSTKVESAFSEMLNGNQVIISRINENENTFSNTYSASYKNVFNIYNKYKYLLDGIGVNYLVNFEDFFKTNNEFYIDSVNKRIPLESLSARNINDFQWIDENSQKVFYPFSYDLLDDDQVILGLSYSDMVNLCYRLQIQRNYTSLGHYIYEKGLNLFLNVKNDTWQYDDEQLLSIVAVCETSSTEIFHTNLLWNEVVFEEMMRLPSDDDEVHDFPWEMYKIYFLQSKGDPSIFLNASLIDCDLENYVFERTNYKYNPLVCKPYDSCENKKIYVYAADKKTLLENEIINYQNLNKDKCDFYYTTDFGYASFSSNLFSGFSRNVFVSPDRDKIDDAIDADNKLDLESNLTIDLPDGIVQGNYLLSMSNGLKFSTDMNNIIYGRKPTNLNEIVISKGLGELFDKETLNLGKYLEFSAEIEEFYDSDKKLNKVYNTSKLLVVGVVDEDKNYFYHSGNWTISFFRDKLGVSNFYLIPKSVVFEFHEKSDAEKGYSDLQKIVKNYRVESPIESLKGNIQTTLDYANTILVAFSVLSFSISVLLLGTVIMLNILESKNDVKLLSVLGISNKDIKSCFVYQSVIQGLISFCISAFEIICVDTFLSIAIGNALKIGFSFSLNEKPILIILLMATCVPILITKFMLVILKKT